MVWTIPSPYPSPRPRLRRRPSSLYAEFGADFPDDHIWNADESDVVQTGGKAVAEAIAEILAGFGCTIGKMEDKVGHCWKCSFSYEGLRLLFRVVALERCIFVLEEPARARPDYALHLHVLLKFNEQLRRDGRFHDLAWRAHDGWRTGEETFDLPVVGEVRRSTRSGANEAFSEGFSLR